MKTTATTALRSSSNRADFKSTPIIPSILSYIEKIGVGIRPKPSRPRNKSKKQRHLPSDDVDHVKNGQDTLNEFEEREYFNQNRRTQRHRLEKWQKNYKSTAASKNSHQTSKKDSKSDRRDGSNSSDSSRTVGAYWLPPPPFSSHTRGDTTTRQRRRRPVKILGSAASLTDELPFESKHLSEIAIAGRSNVGKSTLLNALLYGNIDIDLSPRKYQRGQTPEGAKLPRGIKAITSDKPGETKRMCFYQLTADVVKVNNVLVANSAFSSSLTPPSNINNKTEKSNDDDDEDDSKNQQCLNYSLVFVDLPGFGFAFAKEEQINEWNELMHHYLLERRSLKRILLLLDARHGFKRADLEFLDTLQGGLRRQQQLLTQESSGEDGSGGEGTGIMKKKAKKKRRELPPIQIVLTKCDLVKQIDLARRVVVVRQQLSDALARETSSLPVMLVSARAGLGFNNLRGPEQQPMGGILELQKELASLCSPQSRNTIDAKKK